MATKISLALIPSNQKDNAGVIPGYTEDRGMFVLCQLIKAYANTLPDFECAVFWSWAEGYVAGYPGLREQHRLADVWLAGKTNPLVLDLHTDAFAGESHVAACYGVDMRQVKADSKSWKLAMAVAKEINGIFKTQLMEINHGDYIFYTATEYTSALVEVCAHDNLGDLTKLFANFDAVSKTIVHGVLKYAGRPIPVIVVQDTRGIRSVLAMAKLNIATVEDMVR